MSSASRASRAAAATGLAAVSAAHVVWAAGSAWPLGDRAALAGAVVGRRDGEMPSSGACLLVAGLLALSACSMGGEAGSGPPGRAALARVTVAVLVLRGAVGLAGRTDLLSPGSSSPRFRALDRRLYSPACLALAGLALPAARPHGSVCTITSAIPGILRRS
jgi:hypothetical protein